MNIYLFLGTIITIIVLIYLYQLENSLNREGFQNSDKKQEATVNSVLQKEQETLTQTTCDPTKGGICYIDGMPKKIVDTVIANVVEDEHYRNVFKKIRSYTPSNIYQCVGGTNPMMSVKPLGSL